MVLSLHRVSFTYNTGVGVRALREVDLELEAGDMVCLAGPSGSGKTSLLNIMGLIQPPTAGEVVFMGERVSQLSADRAAEWRNAHIGFVFQHHLLLPELTAVENVAINGTLASRLTWSRALDRAAQLLSALGLAQRAHHFPRQLSGGEQQRVAIARALINNPTMLLADEPSGNLDRANARKILKIFQALNAKTGHTLVIATHDPEMAAGCHRRIVIEDGAVVEDRRTAPQESPDHDPGTGS